MPALVRASALQGYAALMRGLGGDPVPLLRRHRIPSGSLTDEDALLSLRSCVQLLEASASETGCANFGLRLSQVQDIGVLGPLGIVLQNAPTVREAWEATSRYLFVQSPGLAMEIHDVSSMIEGAAEMTVEIRLAKLPARRQAIDLCLGHLHGITRLLAGPLYQLRAVALPHAPAGPIAAYRRFFGAPVHAEQPRAALHVSRDTLRADLRGANSALRQITEDYLARHFQDPGESVTARVRQAVRRTLGTPQGNKTGIASLLAMHPRTLQRHLSAERTTFESIRKEARKDAALHYLRETRIPLGQLAGLLGFSEQSAMTRSCRRWFGTPPSVLRRG
jgi:AraC-like DNA-binding protein